ncbi:MAG TPA: translation elongation factor Ts [Vicinamibacteria bacterium]
MSDISAEQVKNLRQKTGAGLMECKKALVDAGGDVDEAVTILRKRGQAAAEKKAGRTTSEGLIGSYVHGGKIGVLIEVNCETDFVAKTPQFQELVKNLAMQVAAAQPRFVRREDVPEEVLAKEREILTSQAEASGKPPQVVAKIVEGKLGKFYAEAVLLEQRFIKNKEGEDISVQEHITSMISVLKENIQVRRFARFERGEPI